MHTLQQKNNSDKKKAISTFTPAYKIGAANSRLEYEADRTARQVMQIPQPLTESPHSQYTPVTLATTKADKTTAYNPNISDLSSASGLSGERLDADKRQFMESRFNYDFAHVRLHRGSIAEQACEQVNARAFTLGSNIVFGKHAFQPGSRSGKHLLAHELAHVVQQNNGAAPTMIQRQEITGAPILAGRSTPLTTPSMAEFLGSLTVDSFVFGQSDLTSAHQTSLAEHAQTLISLLRDHPGGIIIITGHTDAPGEDVDNVALGQARAERTKTFLMTQGISADALLTSSEGEGALRVQTTRRNPRNRRVEINFRASSPFSSGLDLSLTPPPGQGAAVAPRPRIPLPSEIPPHILLPTEPTFGPRRPPQRNLFDLPEMTRTPRPDFLRETSRWLTGRLGRRDIARLAGRLSGALGMNEDRIRRQLDDALVSGGEAGLKELIKRLVFAIAGTPSSRPSNEFGPALPGGDAPGTRIFKLPAIPF